MDGLDNFCLKVDESQRRSEEVIEMRMPEEFVEQEQRQSVDQEDAREMQQPWWKRTKEEADSSSCELGHGEWPYDPELEQLMEECESRINSSVPLLIYITQKYNDSPPITLGQIGDKGDGPTNHTPSPSN
jgi:hypothetical protein